MCVCVGVSAKRAEYFGVILIYKGYVLFRTFAIINMCVRIKIKRNKKSVGENKIIIKNKKKNAGDTSKINIFTFRMCNSSELL